MTGIDFDCPSCATTHCGTDGTRDRPWPVLAFDLPDLFVDLAPHRLRDVGVTDDLCWIDRPEGVRYFARVAMPMPIRDDPERRLDYAPWVALAEPDVLDILEHIEDDSYRAVYSGQLSTALPDYAAGPPVPLLVRSRGHLRPVVGPEPDCEHPLARDLAQGISREEAELRIRAFLLSDPLD